MKSLKDRAPTFVLAAYWIALVIGTHLPADQMPNTFSTADKALHIVAYAGLTILLAFTIYRTAPIKFWEFYLFFGLSLFGALDEYTQGFVGRMPDVLDWVADVFGIGLGLAGAGEPQADTDYVRHPVETIWHTPHHSLRIFV